MVFGDLPNQFTQDAISGRIPLPRSTSVDLPATLVAHLQDLAASIGQDDQDLDDTLSVLTAALRLTAATYCGFQLTLVLNQWPVMLSAFADGHDAPVGTSLRLPLVLVSPLVDPASRVVFFAVTPARSPISPPT